MEEKTIQRKCAGCNKLFDRKDLIKITKLKNDEIKINPKSSELGRSVYLCKNPECIKNFLKKKRIRSLKSQNSSEILRVEEELKKLI